MGQKQKVSAISLGCPKNLVDTEIMLGILRDEGYEFTFNPEEADILIINTCAFLKKARDESLEVIAEYAGRYDKLIVAGCMVEIYGKKLLDEFPLIDYLINVKDIKKIGKVIGGNEECIDIDKKGNYSRLISTLPHTAYVKIADGCNNRCSYCLIPCLRGTYNSRDIDEIVDEIKELVQMNTREINLIAQDITYYGVDRYGKLMLPELLIRLMKEVTPYWLRLMYTHPAHFSQELINIIASYPNICNYIDLPVQHIDDLILQTMNRKVSSYQIRDLIYRLREGIPDIAIRTSIIVGFPGEGEKEFKKLLEFIEEIEFEHLGVFTYSKEEGTSATCLPAHVPEKVKQDRYHQVMELQHKISLKKKKNKIGKCMNIIVEDYYQDGVVGRSQYEAPEIDGVIYVKCKPVKIGDIIPVKIIDALEYDLIGVRI
jgi:ribosomal protein S12 methylthiotransferase